MNRHARRAAAKHSKTDVSDARAGTPAALHETGLRLMQAGQPLDALRSFRQVLAVAPRHWDAACKAGILHYQMGQLEEALACFTLCDELQPNNAPTLYMRAVFLRDLNRFEEALAVNRRAHALDPANPDTCNNIGNILQLLGRFEEAMPWLDRAIAARPDFVEALYNKAVSLGKLKRPDEAFAVYGRLKTLGSTEAVTDSKLALLLFDLGRLEEALVHFDRCVEREPNHAPTLHMRALTLRRLKRNEEALADNRRAHALDPTNADTCNNLGGALMALDREDEALPWFERALALRPGFVDAMYNKATALVQVFRFDEGFATYQEVLRLDPDHATAQLGLAHLQLLLGDFEAGWAGREARWRMPDLPIVHGSFSSPMWLGEQSLEGKTLLMYADEGLGDAIQFVRYVPMAVERGARIILAVHEPLISLLKDVPGVTECLPITIGTLPPLDVYCPMTSLPLAFGTRLDNIPAPISYLRPAAPAHRQAWEDRLGPHDRLRVGLVWSGNPKHMNDRNRSITLQMMTRLLDVDATFVSLQKDPKAADQAILRERPEIIDLTAALTDFAETAALVSCLDLVISVDTSVAHLAAALGCPTWIMLSYMPDCRWLLGRDDSPWYPTVRLFRQTETRDYTSVLNRIHAELETLAAQARTAANPSARESATALCDAGRHHLQAGRPVEARNCCEKALAADANNADALHLMGLLSLHNKQYDLAVEWTSRALRREPKAEYLSSLGTALLHQGRYEEALATFDKAVQIEPDNAALWVRLGNILIDLERPTDALLGFGQALALDPRHWEAAFRSGYLHIRAERWDEAVSCFNLCVELQPNSAQTLQLRARCLRKLRRLDEALADNRRAHALDPTDADICNNAGAVLEEMDRPGEALPWFDRALALRPDFVLAHRSRAFVLGQLHRFDEAAASYARVLALDPGNALATWNLSLLQMLTGNFAAGWAGREARWQAGVVAAYPAFSQPRWLGQGPINGKTVLVYADEGLGDAIQFARYTPMLAARGARVILVVPDAVHALLSDLPGVSNCIPKSTAGALPAFDMHCPLSSLPLAFATRLDTIPAGTSYLPAADARRITLWENRLGPHDRPRVGLVWSGNPAHKNNHNRSIPLRVLTPLLALDATFVSLQKEPRDADVVTLRAHPGIVDLTPHLTDFVETAALVSCLDLVISVDTSVAHLAGALGCATWILLPYTPDWRWLLDRNDSPWYPTVRLFRQSEARDYAPVLDRVAAELATLIAAFRAADR